MGELTGQNYRDADIDADPGAVASILRAYGCQRATLAETRAMVDVLDRMGAFHHGERRALIDAGMLGHG